MGCYLLIILSEPICKEHKEKILQRVAKGLLSWDSEKTECDLMEVEDILQNKLSKNNIEISEILLQHSNDKLAIEVLLNPQIYTLKQCLKNLLLSPTAYKHIIHAGYSFSGTGSWMCDDGVFEFQHFIDTFHDKHVENFLQSFPYGFLTVHIHCAPVGQWVINDFKAQSFAKYVKVELNPSDSSHGVKGAASLLDFFDASLMQLNLETKMSASSVVGNIRFERPTLYIFPSGQGNCSLFGITGFTMLIDGGFTPVPSFWNFIRHLERLDAIMVTRLNEDNLWGVSSLFKKKALYPVYPQIGYIFCNIVEGNANGLTEKKQHNNNNVENKELVISVIEVGQELLENLKHVGLNPLHCLREPLDTIEPMVLYHKVGHGTLEMYILSPPRDSRILNEFLEHWNASKESFSDVRTSSASVNGSDIAIPISNIMSICCLLIWRPYDKNDKIARMLFPGSAPQSRIFEGLERVKKLSILQHQSCTQQTIIDANNVKTADQISRFNQKSRFRSASPIFRNKKPKQFTPHDNRASVDIEKGAESSDASISPKQKKKVFPQKPPVHQQQQQQQNVTKNVQPKPKTDKQEQQVVKKDEKLLSAKKAITKDVKKQEVINDKRKSKAKSRSAKDSVIRSRIIAPNASPPKTDDTDDEVLKITLTMNGYDKTEKPEDSHKEAQSFEPFNIAAHDLLRDDVEPDSLDSHSHDANTEMCKDSLDVSEDEAYTATKASAVQTVSDSEQTVCVLQQAVDITTSDDVSDTKVEHNANVSESVEDKSVNSVVEQLADEESYAHSSNQTTIAETPDNNIIDEHRDDKTDVVQSAENLKEDQTTVDKLNDKNIEIDKEITDKSIENNVVSQTDENIDDKHSIISKTDTELLDNSTQKQTTEVFTRDYNAKGFQSSVSADQQTVKNVLEDEKIKEPSKPKLDDNIKCDNKDISTDKSDILIKTDSSDVISGDLSQSDHNDYSDIQSKNIKQDNSYSTVEESAKQNNQSIVDQRDSGSDTLTHEPVSQSITIHEETDTKHEDSQKEAQNFKQFNIEAPHAHVLLRDDVEPDSLDSHSHEANTEMCRDSLDVSEDEAYSTAKASAVQNVSDSEQSGSVIPGVVDYSTATSSDAKVEHKSKNANAEFESQHNDNSEIEAIITAHETEIHSKSSDFAVPQSTDTQLKPQVFETTESERSLESQYLHQINESIGDENLSDKPYQTKSLFDEMATTTAYGDSTSFPLSSYENSSESSNFSVKNIKDDKEAKNFETKSVDAVDSDLNEEISHQSIVNANQEITKDVSEDEKRIEQSDPKVEDLPQTSLYTIDKQYKAKQISEDLIIKSVVEDSNSLPLSTNESSSASSLVSTKNISEDVDNKKLETKSNDVDRDLSTKSSQSTLSANQEFTKNILEDEKRLEPSDHKQVEDISLKSLNTNDNQYETKHTSEDVMATPVVEDSISLPLSTKEVSSASSLVSTKNISEDADTKKIEIKSDDVDREYNTKGFQSTVSAEQKTDKSGLEDQNNRGLSKQIDNKYILGDREEDRFDDNTESHAEIKEPKTSEQNTLSESDSYTKRDNTANDSKETQKKFETSGYKIEQEAKITEDTKSETSSEEAKQTALISTERQTSHYELDLAADSNNALEKIDSTSSHDVSKLIETKLDTDYSDDYDREKSKLADSITLANSHPKLQTEFTVKSDSDDITTRSFDEKSLVKESIIERSDHQITFDNLSENDSQEKSNIEEINSESQHYFTDSIADYSPKHYERKNSIKSESLNTLQSVPQNKDDFGIKSADSLDTTTTAISTGDRIRFTTNADIESKRDDSSEIEALVTDQLSPRKTAHENEIHSKSTDDFAVSQTPETLLTRQVFETTQSAPSLQSQYLYQINESVGDENRYERKPLFEELETTAAYGDSISLPLSSYESSSASSIFSTKNISDDKETKKVETLSDLNEKSLSQTKVTENQEISKNILENEKYFEPCDRKVKDLPQTSINTSDKQYEAKPISEGLIKKSVVEDSNGLPLSTYESSSASSLVSAKNISEDVDNKKLETKSHDVDRDLSTKSSQSIVSANQEFTKNIFEDEKRLETSDHKQVEDISLKSLNTNDNQYETKHTSEDLIQTSLVEDSISLPLSSYESSSASSIVSIKNMSEDVDTKKLEAKSNDTDSYYNAKEFQSTMSVSQETDKSVLEDENSRELSNTKVSDNSKGDNKYIPRELSDKSIKMDSSYVFSSDLSQSDDNNDYYDSTDGDKQYVSQSNTIASVDSSIQSKNTKEDNQYSTEESAKQSQQSIVEKRDSGSDIFPREPVSQTSIRDKTYATQKQITDLDIEIEYEEEVFSGYGESSAIQTDRLTVAPIQSTASKSIDDDEFDNLVEIYETQQIERQYSVNQPKSELYRISSSDQQGFDQPSSSTSFGGGASGGYTKQSPQDITEYSIESTSLNVAYPEMITVSGETTPRSTPSSRSQSLCQSKESIDDEYKLAKTSQEIVGGKPIGASKQFPSLEMTSSLEYPIILPMSLHGSSSGSEAIKSTTSGASKNIIDDKEMKIIEAQSDFETDFDIKSWGKPLKLPTLPVDAKTKSNKPPKRSTTASNTIIYVDLAYVPHHADQHYCNHQYFQTIRARYYVFSGIDPHRQVFDALIEGKKQWAQKFQTTVIPTHDSETLSYWIANNQELLRENNIDVAPAANRCTVNLQNHDTKCSAYRVEF